MTRFSVCLLSALWLGVGCDEGNIVSGTAQKPVQRKQAAEEKDARDPVSVPVDFQEAEFVESDRSRDPFRSFASYFVQESQGQVKSQREVVLGQYSIDELKLVGIVTRINPAKAMLVDPTGMGHVVSRGQFVGRPAVVQPASGLGAAYEVNWRIDRIRDGDIVLVREDPANPDVPSAIRVIALRGENDDLVIAGEGEPALAVDSKALDRQVDELKQRLESVEQRRTTVEVRERSAASDTAAPPQGTSSIVRAPRAN